MDLIKYHEKIGKVLARLAGQQTLYEAAAQQMADVVNADGLIHVLGTDMHTTSSVDELFFRFGALAAINPLYDPSMAVTHNAARALYVKEFGQCSSFLIEYYRNISKGDVMLLLDNNGRSCFSTQAAKKAAEMGVTVIAITSEAHTMAMQEDSTVCAEPCVKLQTMSEVSLVIDNAVPPFDALDGLTGLGWVSAIANSFILNAIMITVHAELTKRKKSIDFWQNFDTADGAARNQKLIEQYINRIKHI